MKNEFNDIDLIIAGSDQNTGGNNQSALEG